MNSRIEKTTRSRRRRAIITIIRELGRPFTTEQLWKICAAMPNPISRATLYRVVRTLREDGTIKNIFLPNGQQVAMYTEATIFCVTECLDCGRYASTPELTDGIRKLLEPYDPAPSETSVFLRRRCSECDECPFMKNNKNFKGVSPAL